MLTATDADRDDLTWETAGGDDEPTIGAWATRMTG